MDEPPSGEEDNVVPITANNLSVWLCCSNSKSEEQSFETHLYLMSRGNIVQDFGSNSTALAGFRYTANAQTPDPTVHWQISDVDQYLREGTPYCLYVELRNSIGAIMDCFFSNTFYWKTATTVKLVENQRHLYLHVYDSRGNHVGLNYTTNETDLGVPDSYYHDDLNGTTVIVVPQITNLTVVVDAKYAQEPIESYNLTVTTTTEQGVSSQVLSGNIAAGENQTIIIPEFPSAIMLFLLMITIMLAAALTRKNRNK